MSQGTVVRGKHDALQWRCDKAEAAFRQKSMELEHAIGLLRQVVDSVVYEEGTAGYLRPGVDEAMRYLRRKAATSELEGWENDGR